MELALCCVKYSILSLTTNFWTVVTLKTLGFKLRSANQFSYVSYGKSGKNIKLSTVLQNKKKSLFTSTKMYSNLSTAVLQRIFGKHEWETPSVKIETCEFLRKLSNDITTLPSAFV